MPSKADTTATVALCATQTTDVLVVGGGIAGSFAALGAARQGCDVLLVEQHGFVGGQGTAGGVHTFCGETQTVNTPWRQLLNRLAEMPHGLAAYQANADGRHFDREALKLVLQDMLHEAGARVLLHTSLINVQRDSDRVAAVLVHNKSGITRIVPRIVIDASGDADVVAAGGWGFDKGGPVFLRDAGGTVRRAGEQPDQQLPMSLYFTMVDTGAPVPAWSPDPPTWHGDDDLPMTSVYAYHGYIVVKMKVISFDAVDGASLSAAEQAARRQMYRLAHHLQTQGYQGTRYPTYAVAWTAPHIGIREGRRIRAQRPLTLADLRSGRRFPDAVGVGSYHIDYHWPTDVRRNGTGLTTQVPPYQIPLSAMRPVGSADLLVPGRCMGGDQAAMSSYRVMGTCAQSGFGAGVAAAAARRTGLDGLDLAEVRERLRGEGVRLDLAPYTNYLRARRSVDETVVSELPQAPVAVALAHLPDGDVVCAWAAGSTVMLARRQETKWQAPRRIAALDEPVSMLAFVATGDERRLLGERRDRFDGPDEGVKETDDPARLALRVDSGATTRILTSHDGAHTWTAGGQPVAAPVDPMTVAPPPYPADPGWPDRPPLVRLMLAGGGALQASRNAGADWITTASLTRPRGGPLVAGALDAIASGVATVLAEADRIRYVTVAYETAVADTDAVPALRDHLGGDWLDLLDIGPRQ